MDFREAWSFVYTAIHNAYRLQNGHINNTLEGLQILKNIGIRGSLTHALIIVLAMWLASKLGWIKINTDDAALGAPRMAGHDGVFRNSQGFVKGCFLS